jgi:hypothetical protein
MARRGYTAMRTAVLLRMSKRKKLSLVRAAFDWTTVIAIRRALLSIHIIKETQNPVGSCYIKKHSVFILSANYIKHSNVRHEKNVEGFNLKTDDACYCALKERSELFGFQLKYSSTRYIVFSAEEMLSYSSVGFRRLLTIVGVNLLNRTESHPIKSYLIKEN